jgi:hypothetical protein
MHTTKHNTGIIEHTDNKLIILCVTPRVFAQWCFVLMTLLTHTLANHENPKSTPGQNPSLKPHCSLWPLCAILELWHVLQNFPKHFKTPQREKCAEFQGTQLCCWVTLLVWGVGGWKWKTRPWFTVHRRRDFGQIGMVFLLDFLSKTTTNLCESFEGCVIFNFASDRRCTFVWKFREKLFWKRLSETQMHRERRDALGRDVVRGHVGHPPYVSYPRWARTPRR